jgi:hypothetical protein
VQPSQYNRLQLGEGQGAWFDVTLSPGNPLPFYYASSPLFGFPLSQSVNGGMPHNLPVGQLGYKTYLKTSLFGRSRSV